MSAHFMASNIIYPTVSYVSFCDHFGMGMTEFIFFVLSLSWFFLLGASVISVAGYFVPSIIAGVRGHKDLWAIIILNLLLGWTFFGWVIALIWSVIERGNSPGSGEVATGEQSKAEKLFTAFTSMK